MKIDIPRIVVAGTQSGVGKTTVVTGLLAALRTRGLAVQSYKVGPDYIDPGYHQLASGKPAHNLDTWLVPPEKLPAMFAAAAADSDIAVIEGVMGLYDGGQGGISSTAAIAKQLKAPVLLVLDARSAGESVAATLLGFLRYDPEVNIAGVLVNRLGSPSHKQIVCEAIERMDVPILGRLHRAAGLGVNERHLGLTPVTETDAAQAVVALAAQMAAETDIAAILKLARQAPPLEFGESLPAQQGDEVAIGVAQDEAFTFYYPESLAELERLGARIVPFSPLRDQALPQVDGLILGGGFPEMFLAELAANRPMLEAIRAAATAGLPIYAECGGFLYLTRQIRSFAGENFSMVGLVPATCRMERSLQTVGYVEARALQDTVLCAKDESLRGHEFHFSTLEPDQEEGFPWALEFRKNRTGAVYPGGFARNNLLASYLHLHFAGNEPAARRFLANCRQFRERGTAK